MARLHVCRSSGILLRCLSCVSEIPVDDIAVVMDGCELEYPPNIVFPDIIGQNSCQAAIQFPGIEVRVVLVEDAVVHLHRLKRTDKTIQPGEYENVISR